jgi:hypothetical protein
MAAFVQPAFNDHKQAENGNAVKKSENRPKNGRDKEPVQNNDDGSGRSKYGKGSDVSDPFN